MKNTSYFLLAIAFVVSTSCGPNKKSNVTTPPPTTNNTLNQAPVNATIASDAAPQLAPPQTQEGTPATAVALNPAHGMPNHRCDIAVGAPLNSAPRINVTPAPKLPTPTLPVATPGIYAAGTNPAHGQPGHDCSIAVGAPLKK